MSGADAFRHHFCYVVGFIDEFDEMVALSIWRARHAAEERVTEMRAKIEFDNLQVFDVGFGDAGVDYSCRSGDGSRPPFSLADLVDPDAKPLTHDALADLLREFEP